MAAAVSASHPSLNHPMFRSASPSIASSPPLRVAAAAASFRVSPASTKRKSARPLTWGGHSIRQSCNSSGKPFGVMFKTRSDVSCAADDSGKFDLDHIKAKDAVVPWHLITPAMVFVLLKLPGPYYPFCSGEESLFRN
ncbi:hypothetical protein AKJ16_DCAP04598 [Drosera capensis]